MADCGELLELAVADVMAHYRELADQLEQEGVKTSVIKHRTEGADDLALYLRKRIQELDEGVPF